MQDPGQVAGHGAVPGGQDQPEPEVPPQETNRGPGLRGGAPPPPLNSVFFFFASFCVAVTFVIFLLL